MEGILVVVSVFTLIIGRAIFSKPVRVNPG